MARKKSEDTPEEGAPGWMVTYGDLMGLLLTFFILIVSFSSIQQSKFKQAAGSLSAALGVLPLESGVRQNTLVVTSVQNDQMDEMIENVQEMKSEIAEKNLQDQVKVILTDKGAHIVISDPVLFDLGKADLKPQAIGALDIIAELITKTPESEVIVEGHTDNLPINTPQFDSNWELSSARALAVVKYFSFRKGFDPARFAGTGYGEYRPLVENDSPENRARNRRVEIYVNTKKPLLNSTISDK